MLSTLGVELAEDDSDGSAAPNRMFNTFADNVLGNLSANTGLYFVTVYVGQDGGAPLVYDSTEDSQQGGAGGTPLPPNCAFLVRKRTSLSGRRGRGRMYLPGVPEGLVDPAGNITGSAVTDLQNGLDNWWDELTGVPPGTSAYPPVVLHRSEGAGVEPAPTPILSFQAESKIATQRRRLRP